MTDHPAPAGATAPRRIRSLIAIPVIVAVVALVVATMYAIDRRGRDDASPAQRRAEVKGRGGEVMPFDLDETSHRFTDLPDGGVQVVTANDPTDTQQIALVQAHLREEQRKLARGDYDDPTAIHGQEMPGVSQLRAGASRVRVRYESFSGGARLRYTTADPKLVTALHAWFEAQSTDHGSDH